ncbi:MAG: hypothetical protein ACE5FN_00780 [Leptospirillia bacterium]
MSKTTIKTPMSRDGRITFKEGIPIVRDGKKRGEGRVVPTVRDGGPVPTREIPKVRDGRTAATRQVPTLRDGGNGKGRIIPTVRGVRPLPGSPSAN